METFIIQLRPCYVYRAELTGMETELDLFANVVWKHLLFN